MRDLRTQVRRIVERARLLQGVGADALVGRPAPTRWSAAECLAHLNLSIEPYFPAWHEAVSGLDGRSVPPAHRYRLDFWGRVLTWTLEPPPRFRFPAPAAFHPVELGEVATVLPAFLDHQQRLLELIDRAAGKPVDAVRIASPFDPRGRVRYSVWSSFCVTLAHERRHLWQAEQAVR
ncbi:MAG: DinB family protein [Vicinamibacterales bacterium]